MDKTKEFKERLKVEIKNTSKDEKKEEEGNTPEDILRRMNERQWEK